MILPILYALFFAINATNDEPTSPDLFGNTLNREDDTTDDYFEQLALGALFDEHERVMLTFGEYENTDFDIGPLNELSDYDPDGRKKFWDKNIPKWRAMDEYQCFEFDQSDPSNPSYRCEFCGKSGKKRGLSSWTVCPKRKTTTRMNEHLLSDQHKATMSDNSVPELKEKMKKQQDAFKQRVRNAQ